MNALLRLKHVLGTSVPAARDGELLMAIAGLLIEQAEGWREIKSDLDMPDRSVTCLIWVKGAEHPTLATCNVDVHAVKYFILANSGTAKRIRDEVTHWKPVGPGPYG